MILLLACAEPPRDLRHGQWVWTERDVAVLRPGVIPAILVAELAWDGDEVTTALRSSPRIVEGERGVVIRLDDTIAGAWEGRSDEEVAALLDPPLARILAQVHAAGVDPVEVQLDHDCPVRLLGRWAAVVDRLGDGALRGEEPWVTSLAAHVREPAYGALFRGAIRGHVLQVFDTGDDPLSAAEVGRLGDAAALPYRLGVGAFERERDGRPTTDHRAWLAHLGEACPPPWCIGVDVFPAGRAYDLP